MEEVAYTTCKGWGKAFRSIITIPAYWVLRNWSISSGNGISGIDSNPVDLATAYAKDVTLHQPVADCVRPAPRRGRFTSDSASKICATRPTASDVSTTILLAAMATQMSILRPPSNERWAGIESEARRLWSVIDKPNVMIKVPATDAGLVAMRRCIAAGVNVNATLIFGARRYREVTEPIY